MDSNQILQGLTEFLRKSPGSYHAVDSVQRRLEQSGFRVLRETERWDLRPGDRCCVVRGGRSILSFQLPKKTPRRFRLIASHADSPSFKIKPGGAVISEGLTRLNVERYGGSILSTWFDRPLSIAGRVIVREGDQIRSRLVYPERDLALIPSLAIHLSHSGADKELSVQTHLLPLISDGGSELVLNRVLEECGVDPETVLETDLFLACRAEPTVWGANHEFYSAPRLDDLACVYCSLEGFMNAEAAEDVLVHCVFGDEEVGSNSQQGAASTFLRDVIARICCAYSVSADERAAMLSSSFLISADNAHAAHPAYPGVYDPVNRPRINGGIVLKRQAGYKYVTDGYSGAVIRLLCEDSGIPLQDYTNHSDQRGGSTLGNISNTQVSMNAADIGLAQLAMHSAFETMGAHDPARLSVLSQSFYTHALPELL